MPPRSLLSEEYVEIQLRFSETMAGHLNIPMTDAVLQCTNLVRRFGLGHPANASTNRRWQQYVSKLADLRSLEDRLSWTMVFASSVSIGASPGSPIAECGPFSAEVIDTTLRTHFMPTEEEDGLSPLDPSKLELRHNELQAVVLDALSAQPGVTRARGVSWLYNTAGYRSLFPPNHIATATARTGIFTFQGSSSWGQFLDHRGEVKPALRDRFIDGLATIDPSAPWLAFPIPTMVVDSPINVFRAYFEP